MFKNRCYSGGHKHKFKPRYSIKVKFDCHGCLDDDFKSKTYIGDVCIWCGKIIRQGEK